MDMTKSFLKRDSPTRGTNRRNRDFGGERAGGGVAGRGWRLRCLVHLFFRSSTVRARPRARAEQIEIVSFNF